MTDTSENQTQSSWEDWIGADVVDGNGDKVGSLENIYMDRATGQPEWLLVKTGLFGSNSSFVPIQGAGADGEDLRVAHSKDLVKDAPNVDDDEGFLPPEEERRLYEHYGREYEELTEADTEADTHQDTSRSDSDSAMTRSEEELDVGTRSVEAGRARLRKYVVTENVTTTVPVRKEVARIVREPVTDGAGGNATIGEEDEEVVLSQEEVVTDKKVVEKERVRLDKDTVVEEQEVSDEVRKEQVEIDGDADIKDGGQ